ncbi:MAG: AAA domain-containing protein, partial [Saprospiraceae bacterium]
MNTIHQRYQQILKAIDAERNHEEQFFKNLSVSKSLKEKADTGFVWYPVKIVRKSYTIGDYVEVEVERDTSNQSHKFSEGMAATLFNTQNEKTEIRATVYYVRNEKMRLTIHADHMETLDVYEKGLSGVEVIYDDKPYKVMASAIKGILESKHPNHRLLRDGLSQKKLTLDAYMVDQYPQELSFPHLNTSQIQAIQNCIKSPIIGIIHGPPGTGKTTTLVHLLQALIKTEKRILVCASSNNAVDLLAQRLDQQSINVLRIGNISRIDDDLMHLTIEEKIRNHPEWSNIKKVKI